jgi:CRP-like cAMP-binding protein
MLTDGTHLTTVQEELARTQLQDTVLFGGLDACSLEVIVNHTTLASLVAGEVLFRQDQPANHVYLLSSGRLKLSRSSSKRRERVVKLVGEGHTFSEAVLFSRRKQYPVTATALIESRVWSIDAEQYRNVLQHSTDACFAALSCISDRLYEQFAEIESLTLHTATSRFIAYLLKHAEPGAAGRAIVRLEAPKNVIASRLAIVPATFSRSLAALSRDGLLEVHDTDIYLLNTDALKELAADVQV